MPDRNDRGRPSAHGVRRRILGVLALLLAVTAAACDGAALTYIRFPVSENGHSVDQKRFFMDGLTHDDPQALAFARAQRGDPHGAIRILAADLARHPGNAWSHYDLGVLYEATDEWTKAEAELKEAQRDNVHERRFTDELSFICMHKGR